MNEVFIRCACGSEGVNVTQDEETGEVYLAMMYNNPRHLRIKHKLRWIWNVLRDKPYIDQIVVSPEWLPLLIDHLRAMHKRSPHIKSSVIDV